MDQDTMAFGGPFALLVAGVLVMLVGIFQGGLTLLTYAGIGLALIAVVGLATSAARAA